MRINFPFILGQTRVGSKASKRGCWVVELGCAMFNDGGGEKQR